MEPDPQKQAHDNAIESGKKLIEAGEKLDKAGKLLNEANIRMSNARKFEDILKERQRKLDRAFIALNKQRSILKSQQLKESERDLIIRENTAQY